MTPIWQNCFDDNNVITANLAQEIEFKYRNSAISDANNNIIDTVHWGGVASKPLTDQL
jgi:hypothetical protein